MHFFISYAKTDTHTLAQNLYEVLNKQPSISAWMDNSLQAGHSWAEQIQNEIKRADYVIVLLSPNVTRSPTTTQRRSFVLNEIDFAQERNIPIIPVMVQPTEVPIQLAGTQYIDVTAIRNTSSQVQKIVFNIEKRLSISVPIGEAKNRRWLHLTKSWVTIIFMAGIFGLIAAFIVLLGGDNAPSVSQAPTRTFIAVEIQKATPIGTPNLTLTLGDTPTSIPTSTQSSTPTATPTNTLIPTLTPFRINTTTPVNTPASVPTATPAQVTSDSGDFAPIIEFDELTQHYRAFVPEGIYTDENGTTFEAFWIDVYEVTNAQYLEFTKTKGYRASLEQVYIDISAITGGIEIAGSTVRIKPGKENFPVVEVTWDGANMYCEWIGGRLPTATEWNKAARWNPAMQSSLTYPWGNGVDFDVANVGSGILQPVGSYLGGTSPTGVQDMIGNVWEWVSDIKGIYHFYVGGAFDTEWRSISLTTLQRSTATNHLSNLGFRCVYEIE